MSSSSYQPCISNLGNKAAKRGARGKCLIGITSFFVNSTMQMNNHRLHFQITHLNQRRWHKYLYKGL